MARPKTKSREALRVRLSTTVAPSTMQALEVAAQTCGSLGAAIDAWWRQMKNTKE